MYSAIFEADNGLKFVFGVNGGNVFDMDLGSGVPVDIGTAQGFLQVGESVETITVSGRNISITGTLYSDIDSQKRVMRKVFAPFVSGRLIFENGYYTRVFVKDPPSFSTIKQDGRFTMLLYAPFPYFYDQNEAEFYVGGITPKFKFPVNYGEPHTFGEISGSKFVAIYNDGDIKTFYNVRIVVNGTSTNPTITNLLTLEFIKINKAFTSGDIIEIYRDENNVLVATVTHNDGNIQDIISFIDDDSTFYELVSGDNLVAINDDEGGIGMTAKISFQPVVVALYES